MLHVSQVDALLALVYYLLSFYYPALIILVAEAPMVTQMNPPHPVDRGIQARRTIELDPAKTGKFSLSFWVKFLT